MARRGSFSLIAMVVINPMVILFYQNCSMIPARTAQAQDSAPVVREVSSIKEQVYTPPLSCHRKKGPCATSSVD